MLAHADSFRTYELVHHLKASKARLVVVQPDLLENILPATKEVGIPDQNVLIFDDHGRNGYKSWRTLLQHGEIDWPRFNSLEAAKNTTLARLFSSGTTGTPHQQSATVSSIDLCLRTSKSSSAVTLQPHCRTSSVYRLESDDLGGTF